MDFQHKILVVFLLPKKERCVKAYIRLGTSNQSNDFHNNTHKNNIYNPIKIWYKIALNSGWKQNDNKVVVTFLNIANASSILAVGGSANNADANFLMYHGSMETWKN